MKKLTKNFKDELKIKDLSFELGRKLNFKESLGCVSTMLLFVLIGCQAMQTFAQTCSTAPANLVSWYRGENNAIDFINANNGTIQGNVTYTTGNVGQTFTLGGIGNTSSSGDRVLVGNPANFQLQNFTIEGWIKRSSNTIVTNSPVSGFAGGTFFAYGANGYGFVIDQSTNRLGLTKIGVSAVYSTLTISDTNFHHVAVTKSGNQVTFYVDGVADAPITYNTTFTFATNAAIGARGDNDARNAFFGSIDELSIYNRSLTASEIQAIAAAGSAGKCLLNTITVTNTNDSGTGSLRQAVTDSNTAATSDTIVFDSVVFGTPQTIALASAITINPAAGDTLTIIGPGVNLLTLDGNDGVSTNVRIFTISSGDTVSISGMTLTNGGDGAIDNTGLLTVSDLAFTNNTNGNGGAISSTGTQLTITNCTFSGNTATSGSATGLGGGAIYQSNAAAVATITGSTFTNNSEIGNSGGGGAIRNRGGSMDILNTTFTGNTEVDPNGGGAIVNSDRMTITGSTFTANTAPNPGGAISTGGTLTITNSLFDSNTANVDAGAIFVFSGSTVNIINSTISNNIANADNGTVGNGRGGGIFNNGNLTVTGSTIRGNQALGTASPRGLGGAIASAGGTMNITNSTVSGNSAGASGGGLYLSGTSTAITNLESATIVSNTSTLAGGGVVRASTTNPVNFHNTIVANNTDDGTAPDISGSVVSQGYNLIETTTGATITGNLTGNITGQDPILGPLQNNGGPTLTHALLAGSPAVDAADVMNFPATDQRGVTRPVDGNPGNLVPQPDIGAFEASFVPTAANVTVAGIVSDGFRGIRNAVVVLTDQNGVSRTAKTGTFGYFNFEDVEAGQTYVVTIISKRYQFTPQIIAVNDHVTDLSFTPEEGSQNTLRAKMP